MQTSLFSCGLDFTSSTKGDPFSGVCIPVGELKSSGDHLATDFRSLQDQHPLLSTLQEVRRVQIRLFTGLHMSVAAAHRHRNARFVWMSRQNIRC